MDDERFDDLDDRIDGLSQSMGSAAQMAASFEGELRRVRGAFKDTGKEIGGLERGLSNGLRRAFDGLLNDGESLSDAFNTIASSIVRSTYNAAMKPATDQLSSTIAGGLGQMLAGAFPFAMGGAFSDGRVMPFADGAPMAQGRPVPFADGAPFTQGRVVPFADGGVVTSPTTFPMRGATGLMGEAGPEAIMPLSRGPDGKLGVRASGNGGQSVSVVMNISTPDAASFRRSQGQIAAQMGRMLGRGNRNR